MASVRGRDLVHTAYSRRQAPNATTDRTATTAADVRDRLATLGSPRMPDYLAAKVTEAIAAESARRGFGAEPARRGFGAEPARRELLTAR